MNPAKEAERLLAEYNAGMDKLAERVRQELVIPYCNRTGYRFTAGMGSWGFDSGGKRDRYGAEKIDIGGWEEYEYLRKALGVRLLKALTLEYHQQDLGSVVPDYTPPNYIPNV